MTFNRSCLSDSQYQILPNVSLYDTRSGNSIQCNITTENEQMAKCELDFKMNDVRIRSSHENVTLTLCSQPRISAFGETFSIPCFIFLGLLCSCFNIFTLFADDFTNIRGVLYEVWDKYTRFNNSSNLKFNEVFSGVPNLSGFSPSFSITAFSGALNYSLREKGYVSVRYGKVDEATNHRKLIV